MKIVIITISLIFSNLIIAQRTISTQDSIKINKEIETEISSLKKELEKNEYRPNYIKQSSIEFSLDTARIEKKLYKKMEIDYSTYGMVESVLNAEKEYDILLTKQYDKLLSILNTISDKKTLQIAQKNWKIFRDSEIILIGKLIKEKYSGGGTIQKLNYAVGIFKLTKNRTIELNNYLKEIVY